MNTIVVALCLAVFPSASRAAQEPPKPEPAPAPKSEVVRASEWPKLAADVLATGREEGAYHAVGLRYQALLARDPARFRSDLETASTWVARYYDTRAKPTIVALASLKQLAAGGMNVELPSISESLAAVRNFKVARDKAVR